MTYFAVSFECTFEHTCPGACGGKVCSVAEGLRWCASPTPGWSSGGASVLELQAWASLGAFGHAAAAAVRPGDIPRLVGVRQGVRKALQLPGVPVIDMAGLGLVVEQKAIAQVIGATLALA